VLGCFDLWIGGRQVGTADWQRISAERLVKLLLVTTPHRLAREVAAETLWPETDPVAGRTNLRKALHFARQALGDASLLESKGDSIAIDPDRLDLDLDALHHALDTLANGHAPSGNPAATMAALDTVLRLGGRDLLPDDRFEDWLAGPRERLRREWRVAALGAAKRARDTGRIEDAHRLVAQLLQQDRTDEAAHRLAIELYFAEGRHHAARRQLEECRQALAAELDAEPSPETLAAFREPVAPAAVSGMGLRGGPGGMADMSGPRVRQPSPRPHLVARGPELERMEPLLDRVAAGRSCALVIHGPAGIGKSRLLDELLAYPEASGWRVVTWRAIEAAAQLPYGPIRAVIRTVGGERPGIDWDETSRLAIAALRPAAGAAGAPFLEAASLTAALVSVVRQLAEDRCLVLAIDDLPWLDPPCVELLRLTLAGLPKARVLVALTYRDDEPVPASVAPLLDQLGRSEALDISLGPIPERDLEALLLAHLGGASVEAGLLRTTYELSLGNPLFCLELLRAWSDHSAVKLLDDRWLRVGALDAEPLPRSVRRLVAGRMERLAPEVGRLLEIAAELGPTIQYETLATVFAEEEEGELLSALDRALDVGLLMEQNSGYAFAHPLFRAAVRQSAGTRRRGIVSRRIALALAHLDPSQSQPDLGAAAREAQDPVPVADHALTAAEQGFTECLPMAVAFGFAAGERALALFDAAQARDLLERAVAAWHRLPPDVRSGLDACAAQIHLGTMEIGVGDDSLAEHWWREAIAAAATPDQLAAGYRALSWIPYQHGDFLATLSILDEGVVRLPPGEPLARAILDSNRGWCIARLGRHAEALELLTRVVEVFDSNGSVTEAMTAYDYLGQAYSLAGSPRDGLPHLERSLAYALDLGSAMGEVRVRIHLGSIWTAMGTPARARPHLERAIDLAVLTGDRYTEAIGCWKSAEMWWALRDDPKAAQLREREVALLASIGGNPRHEALAHAHLFHIHRRRGDPERAASAAAAATTLALACDEAYSERIETLLRAGDWTTT